jgi:hypothetical protein
MQHLCSAAAIPAAEAFVKSRSLHCLLFVCILSSTIWNAGCGMSSSQPVPPSTTSQVSNTTQALYVGTASGIAGYGIHQPDGKLTALVGSPFAPFLRPLVMRANPGAPFILAEDLNAGFWALRVNPQGTLEATANLPFPATAYGFPSFGVSASGSTIFLGNYLRPLMVSAHSFDANTGKISPSPLSVIQFPSSCGGDPSLCSEDIAIVGDSAPPSAEYLWVQYTNCGFHADCDNPIEPVAVSNAATLAPNPSGETLTGGSWVSGASLSRTGLVIVQQSICCSGTSIGSYVVQKGSLVSAGGCSIDTPACATAWSVATHPNQDLVVIGTNDNTLLAATRDSAGNLTMPFPINITLPMRPERLLFDNSGQHLYVLGSQSLIFGFSVDPVTATLTRIAGSPWSTPTYASYTGIIARLPSQ